MCRAVWVVVVGSSDGSVATLRRAVGIEAQVVAAATAADEALEAVPTVQADAFVVDANLPGAGALVAALRERAPGAAVVWVGADPPDGAHHWTPWADDLADLLPGAITKALIARRR